MAIEKEITCIVCPLGCKILVSGEDTQLHLLKGNTCKKGEEYARNEAFDPRRMLTTSMLVTGGEWPLVSVRSTWPVPKEKIFLVLREIQKTTVNAPVESQQVLIKNVLDMGIDIIATKAVCRSSGRRR